MSPAECIVHISNYIERWFYEVLIMEQKDMHKSFIWKTEKKTFSVIYLLWLGFFLLRTKSK